LNQNLWQKRHVCCGSAVSVDGDKGRTKKSIPGDGTGGNRAGAVAATLCGILVTWSGLKAFKGAKPDITAAGSKLSEIIDGCTSISKPFAQENPFVEALKRNLASAIAQALPSSWAPAGPLPFPLPAPAGTRRVAGRMAVLLLLLLRRKAGKAMVTRGMSTFKIWRWSG